MEILKVTDKAFAPYGRVVSGIDTKPFVDALNAATPLPEATDYVPEDPALQNLPEAKQAAHILYGGMPAQFGWCNGHNTKLNCLEYHRDSEFNLGTEDFVLMLAKMEDIEDGKLDTSRVKAFFVPAGVMVEVYATTLHYAPCHTDAAKGFRVMVVLPQGTNLNLKAETKAIAVQRAGGPAGDGAMLWAVNKWLLAHPDTSEAAQGAYVGLVGTNLDLND